MFLRTANITPCYIFYRLPRCIQASLRPMDWFWHCDTSPVSSKYSPSSDVGAISQWNISPPLMKYTNIAARMANPRTLPIKSQYLDSVHPSAILTISTTYCNVGKNKMDTTRNKIGCLISIIRPVFRSGCLILKDTHFSLEKERTQGFSGIYCLFKNTNLLLCHIDRGKIQTHPDKPPKYSA